MAKRNKQQVIQDRWEKKGQEGRKVNGKFNGDEEERYIAKPVQAKNDVQREFLKALNNYQVVLFEAPAGVGKSFLSMSEITDWIKKGYYDKLYLTRPAVGMSKTLGLLPGDMRMKYEPFLLPMVEVIKKRYGGGFYESSIANGTIEYCPLEYIRGRNIDQVAIVDECQNCTPDDIYTMITRIADGGKLILIGDSTQNDLSGKNALQWLPEFIEDNPELKNFIKIIRANSNDIVRGGLCKMMVKAKERSK